MMFLVTFMTKAGVTATTKVQTDHEFVARKAVASRPDCDSIISCEPVAE